MPTYDADPLFLRQFSALTDEEKRLFRVAVAKLVADLMGRGVFRRGLRIRQLARHQGEYEMTWAPDGRAVFRYGDAVHEGEQHIVWLRIGTHDVLDS